MRLTGSRLVIAVATVPRELLEVAVRHPSWLPRLWRARREALLPRLIR